MVRKSQKTVTLTKQHSEKALNDAPPVPLASAGFSELTMRALEDNALRARTTPPQPMSKDDVDSLLCVASTKNAYGLSLARICRGDLGRLL
ncbi:hypothetical protein INH39_02745 [Massilia violaceinigra]|uniref:Uncharacterized protein n=1 Tax=Massilia violaceinigra TaxID=2045208 RepID=A0ABY4ADP6_9BURK|nr:hypothetical protein [Massilia violaceinigra]UOD30683.1 hypothetical protein INH39_02745 [Massilia violaceinigra]